MADSVIDELKIKVNVDTSELESFKRSATGIGTSFTESMNKGLKNFNTRNVVKKVESDANAMAEAMAEKLSKAFMIDDKYAKDEVRKLTKSLITEMQTQFRGSGTTVSKSVDILTNNLADSIKRNGKVVETEAEGYKARLKDFYDWFISQGQIKLPKGFNNPALESLPVFGGKFSKTKGMDLTNQNSLREKFTDLFDDSHLDNQEDAINRIIELVKEYKTTVETIKPISTVFDADDHIYREIIEGTNDVDRALRENLSYVEELRKSGYEVGRAYNFEGDLQRTRGELARLQNDLSKAKANFSDRWSFGSTNFENGIKNISKLEGKIDAVQEKIESFKVGNADDSDVSKIFEDKNNSVKEFAENQKDWTVEAEKTESVMEQIGVQMKQYSMAQVIKEVEQIQADIYGISAKLNEPNKDVFIPQALKDGQKYTSQYADLSKELDKANAKLLSLYNRQEKMLAVGGSRTEKSRAYKNLTYDIQGAEKEVENLENKMRKLQDTGKAVEDIDFNKMSEGARQTSGLLTQLSAALRAAGFRGATQGVSSLGRNFANLSASAEGATGAMAGLGTAIPIIGAVAGSVFLIVKALQKVVSAVGKVAGAIGKAMKSAVENTVKLVKALFGVGQGTNAISRLYNKFLMTLRNRGISKIVMQLFAQAKESLQSLAAFSNRIGSDFNKNVSSLISNFKLLGNSLAAAFEPILNVVTPYLDFLMQKLVDAINVVNQFFSALTGNSTWTKAKYQAVNYGASVEDATKKQKELNKQLQRFDELNNISQNQNSGSGSGSGATSINPNAFTTEQIESDVASFAERFKKAWHDADFSDIGFDFGTAIKNALDGIQWGEIKIAAGKVGKSLATFINGAISVDGLADTLGTTIAQGINTFITGIHGFVTFVNWSGIGTFVGTGIVSSIENIDWSKLKATAGNLGQGIAEGINALLDSDVLASIGKATGNLLKTGVEAWWKFVGTLDFSKLGDKIGDSINAFLDKMSEVDSSKKNGWEKLGENVFKSFTGIVTAVSTAIKKVDWAGVGNAVRDMISQIKWGEVAWQVGNCALSIVAAIESALSGKKVTPQGIVVDSAVNASLKFTKFTFSAFDSNGISVVENAKNIVVDAIIKIIKVLFGEKVSNVIDMVANFKSWTLDKVFNKTISNLIAKFTQKDESGVDKTSTGWTAVFGGKPKVNISKKNKKVSGFTALVTGIKDNIVGEGKKSINGISAKVTSLDTTAVDNYKINMEGSVKPKFVNIDGANYPIVTVNGEPYYRVGTKMYKLSANGGIFGAGSWKSIAQYANGGMPNHGTAFIAGEAGPEIVGHVGNRTEVLNQSQLASTMYSAVLAAMTQANGNGQQPIQVLLDGKVVFDNTRKRADEYYRKTGNSAFAY